MAEQKLPYMNAYKTIPKILERITEAATPPRFTGDFLKTKLGFRSGSHYAVIPFLKRTGFLASDGTPTELYKMFRNEAQTGAAAARGLRIGYAPLFEMNEYVNDCSDKELTGLVVQYTGGGEDLRDYQSHSKFFQCCEGICEF